MSATTDTNLLSVPVTREALHHRRLDFHGYSRSDGLFEIGQSDRRFGVEEGRRLNPGKDHLLGVALEGRVTSWRGRARQPS